jgi:DNA-binding MarR family transcriptional regulator
MNRCLRRRVPPGSLYYKVLDDCESWIVSAKSRSVRPRAVAARSPGAGKSPLQLDRLIHEPLRLGILTALLVGDRLTFTDLKQRLGTTDGNLSVHARKLEKAEYIACDKSFAGRVPRTQYRITPTGRRAFEKYLAQIEGIISAARH